MTTREKVSLAGVAAFAGLLLGLLGPVMLFGSRLSVQESKMDDVRAALVRLEENVRALSLNKRG